MVEWFRGPDVAFQSFRGFGPSLEFMVGVTYSGL